MRSQKGLSYWDIWRHIWRDNWRNIRRVVWGVFWLAFALAATVSVVNCVWFVDVPSEVLARCRVAGEEKPCGTCIRTHCQSSVDGCCNVERCRTSLPSLDQCSSGADGGCRTLHDETADGSIEGQTVSTCITTMCKTECGGI